MSMFVTQMLFAFALFGIGLYGVSSNRDFLRIFFALEMMLNAVIMMLATTAYHLGLSENIPLAYMVMVLATLEAGIGVLIFASANRISGKISPDEFSKEALQ